MLELLIIFVCVDDTNVNKFENIFASDKANKSPLYRAILLYVPL